MSRRLDRNKNAEYMREYRRRRKVAGIPEAKRTRQDLLMHRLSSKFGISLEEYAWLLYHQSFRCKICERAFSEDNKRGNDKDNVVVDHCHSTGRVRGLLCPHCNLGLGHFFDNADLLRKAADYLP